MTDAEVRREIMNKLAVPVPLAGRAIGGLSRGSSYEAAKRGEIPTIEIGRRKAVPTSWLRSRLGIESAP
jgi:hypothetical protein